MLGLLGTLQDTVQLKVPLANRACSIRPWVAEEERGIFETDR